MANAKLDWVLFEKAAAAVKQPRETELTGVSGSPRSIPGKVLPSASGPGKPSGRVPPGTGHHDAPKSRYEALRRAGGKTVSDAMRLAGPQPPAWRMPRWLRRAGVSRHSSGGIQVGNHLFHNPLDFLKPRRPWRPSDDYMPEMSPDPSGLGADPSNTAPTKTKPQRLLGHGGLMERLRSSVSPERFPKPKK